MLHSSIFNWLRLRLLRVAVVGCQPDFGWIIQANLAGHSFDNIIISMYLRPINKSRVDYECLYDSTRDFSTEHKTLLGIYVLTTLDKNHPPSAFPEIGNELSTKNQTEKELSL
jgi:hypothetical protein